MRDVLYAIYDLATLMEAPFLGTDESYFNTQIFYEGFEADKERPWEYAVCLGS